MGDEAWGLAGRPIACRGGIRPYDLVAFAIAVVYGLILAGLPLEDFKDRINYLNYAQDSALVLAGRVASGWHTAFANEPLWLVINILLGAFLRPEQVVRLLIFLPATVVAYFVLCRRPRDFVWLFLFLLLPTVIKNHIIHIRQGLGIALFLVAWHIQRAGLRWAILALTPLIHASFFFVLMLMGIVSIASRLRLAADLRTVLVTTVALALGLTLGSIVGVVGARQGTEYQFDSAGVSGLGFSFWLIVLLIFALQGRQFMREHAFAASAITFYLGMYFFVEVTARVFESTLIFVLLAGLDLRGWLRFYFLSLVAIYGMLVYAMRIGEPWLGFGVS
jgi:hypothetical protein